MLEWNGRDVPPELAAMPPGRYLLEPVLRAEEWGLSAEQIDGLEAAAASAARGECSSLQQVQERLRQHIEAKQRSSSG